MKKSLILALIACFLFAYFIRILFLKDLALTFGYDQARDALSAGQIVSGHLKILGPPASTPGLFHGVFYYYVLAPAYYLGHGNPVVAALWVAFINSLTVLTVFYLTFLFTKKAGAGLLAALFFAVSFEATQYATWLSNPTLGVFTVPLFYLGLWLWVGGSGPKKLGPVLTALGLGLSVQSEIFLAYQAVPLIIWLWVGKKRVTRKSLITFGGVLLLSLSTMIVSEIKFGFKSFGGIAQLLTTQDAIAISRGLGDIFLLFLNQLGRVYAFSSYPGNVGYGSALVGILLFTALYQWSKRADIKAGQISWEPFLATWLLSHMTVVSVGGISTPFLLVGIGPAVAILLAIFVYRWFIGGKRVVAVGLLIIVVLGNLAMIVRENPKGSTIFAIQKDLTLSKELSLIDYTYAGAQGKPFSVNSLTSPLWINIVWTYLYKWYGDVRYGYIPEWHGRDQVGQLDSLPPTSPATQKYFLILEPMAGIPAQYLGQTVGEEDGVSKLIGEKAWGGLSVQERLRNAK